MITFSELTVWTGSERTRYPTKPLLYVGYDRPVLGNFNDLDMRAQDRKRDIDFFDIHFPGARLRSARKFSPTGVHFLQHFDADCNAAIPARVRYLFESENDRRNSFSEDDRVPSIQRLAGDTLNGLSRGHDGYL
jgi:hypothetical protein